MSGHADTIRSALLTATFEHSATRSDVDDALDALVAENQQLRDIEDKARAFVATTSYYVQHSASRPEFEALAFALVDARVAGMPACPRCKGSGVVASVDGEAMDCDCGTPSEDT
jgi:hypothetical protein